MFAFRRLPLLPLPILFHVHCALGSLAYDPHNEPLSLDFQNRAFHVHSNISTMAEPTSLVDWTQTRLGALFPEQNAPQEDVADGQDWFTSAFSRAFAPDATFALATAPTPPAAGDEHEGEEEADFAKADLGEGDDVQAVSGDAAVDALRKLASGGPKVQFEDVRQTAGDDQVRDLTFPIALYSCLDTRAVPWRAPCSSLVAYDSASALRPHRRSQPSTSPPSTTLPLCSKLPISHLRSISGSPRLIKAYSHTSETHRKPTHFPTGLRQSQPVQRVEKEDL
jgi:hypothetical protein